MEEDAGPHKNSHRIDQDPAKLLFTFVCSGAGEEAPVPILISVYGESATMQMIPDSAIDTTWE